MKITLFHDSFRFIMEIGRNSKCTHIYIHIIKSIYWHYKQQAKHNDVQIRFLYDYWDVTGSDLYPWWRYQMGIFSALLALCLGIHRLPVNSPHKGQWRWALKFSVICAWIHGWINNRGAGDLRRYRSHYDVVAMQWEGLFCDFVVQEAKFEVIEK